MESGKWVQVGPTVGTDQGLDYRISILGERGRERRVIVTFRRPDIDREIHLEFTADESHQLAEELHGAADAELPLSL